MKFQELTSEKIKEYAISRGLDLVGIANIERFKDAPKQMHPASIFPECKSVIVVARRIVRGNWRGIEEGTYWPAYTYFGYAGNLNNFFIPKPLYETACFIEKFGWEAVPTFSCVAEIQFGQQVRPGDARPDVNLAIRIAGTAAGLGEMGWSKVFLTKKFGPRVRLHAILTDAELAPDPLIEPGTLCDKCMACVKGCASNAIPHIKDNDTISIQIEDKVYQWANVHMGRCTLAHHGVDPRVSPFIHESWKGFEYDVRKQDVSEETAYKLSITLSRGTWRASQLEPSGYVIEGHARIPQWCDGGLAVEGSRGCMRSCFDHLEKRGKIEQTFHGGPFIKRPRWLLSEKVDS